jgi:TonB-linked SusC/RagA family outer membrane protein
LVYESNGLLFYTYYVFLHVKFSLISSLKLLFMNVVKRLLASALFMLVTFLALAQGKPISGKILADDGAPLAGVTVRVKGTTRSTQTDASGNYTISAKEGDVLQFTYVGYDMREAKVGSSGTVDVRLARSENTLETVTVAMDIKRNPKELGFSVQKVAGAEIAETNRENFVNSLQGRVAGATITPTSGMAGAGTQIVLRGFNSLALDNSPLFVIDGIIVDNQTVNETSNGGSALGLASDRANRSNDYTNRMADINPNDIESITVLKGPEATALYGSQASSGAIVITTKKAQATGKLGISYDNAFRVSKLTRFPSTMDIYSSGTNGQPIGLLNSGSGTYFGPAYAGDVTRYDNIHNFFRTGFAQTHNLSLEYGIKNASFRFSGSLFNQQSPVPTNTYNRYNARISNTTKIGKYVDISPAISFIRSVNEKPLRGASGYMLNLLIWPVTDDVRDYQDADGNKKTLISSTPNSELDNPFFNVYKNRSEDETDRYIGTFGINVNPVSWMTLSGRFGYDTYRQVGYTRFHPLSFYVSRAQGGYQDNYYRDYAGYNHTVSATFRKKVGSFDGRLLVGNMWQDYRTDQYAVSGSGVIDSIGAIGANLNKMFKNGVVVTDANYFQLTGNGSDSNSTKATTRVRLNRARFGDYNYVESRQAAYFGEFTLGWKSAIFLTYSHRFEESSIFPKDFRNYNYPAASMSIMLSDLFPGLKTKTLSFWKIRGSLASTARASLPYQNQAVFNQNTGSGGGYYYGFTNSNPLLKPERQQTFEVGTEMRFFNSRFNIDATFYNTKNTDQIVENFRSSYGTGYVLNTLNVGSTRNKGVEIALDGNVIQQKDLRWNTRFNFNHMWNKVLSLPSNVPEFYNSDTWLYGNARNGLVTGGPTTSITAYGYQRNNNGDILISPSTGLPLVDANFKVRGDRSPDFTLGWVNSVSWKNLRFSMLWDFKVGGDIFNATDMYLTLQGKSKRTQDRMTPRIVKGVLADGLQNTDNPTPNNIAVIPFYNQTYFTGMPEEEFIEHHVNWARLRDVTLNYTFGNQKLRYLRYFKSLSVFVTGNDLLLFTNYSGADPAANANTAGTRGVGAFGFDYGNMPTPISVNFGIKANF